ncbi:CAP domain-containing protein [Circinella umbellata]|nr:CAP domain-containing protein [Circinella umbellata]
MRFTALTLSAALLGFIQVSQAIDQVGIDNALKSHNEKRAKHGAPALKWNATLENFAQSWSDKCDFKHSGGPSGENLAMGQPDFPAAIQDWYDEETKYDYNNPGFAAETGHFTAMVWKATTDLGCGVTDCKDKGRLYTCEYWPAGNVNTPDKGLFKENVVPPQ